MKAREIPYPGSGYLLRVPDVLWAAALDTVRDYGIRGAERGRRGSEALVFLGGVATPREAVVTGLLCIDHEPQGDRVVVTREESRWLLRSLNQRDEKLIGQLHSHRRRAGHSLGDDAWATSFHEGFLSIVVPHFGRAVKDPIDCAVLELRNGEFVQFRPDEIQQRIQVFPYVHHRATPMRKA